MHIKVTSPHDWTLGCPSTRLVKCGSKGLFGHDLNDFIKQASHVFDDQLGSIKIAKDEVPLHVIALGATEAYGPNRNGDGFKAATCRAMHDTFVKHARWYRNHKNKDPAISYGIIKASAFNEKMQRVELIVALNAEKSAADRNGGFVADEELEKIAKNLDIPVSMACKVAYDVCASCGNKARHRDEYCTEETCIGPRGEKRGGCRHNLTAVADDGFINHVDNPNSEWFDMSKVFNPADRIAYGGVANYLQKAASGKVLGGAALAEAWGLSGLYLGREAEHWTAKTAAYRLVERLAEEEQGWCSPDQFKQQAARVVASQHALDLSELQQKKATALGALNKRRLCMSCADFVAWQTGDASEKTAREVGARLPGIYGRLLDDPLLPQMIRENPFDRPIVASEASLRWTDKQASLVPFTAAGLTKAAQLTALRGVPQPVIKTASAVLLPSDSQTERLARSYALYKLAFLATSHDDVAVRMAVAQNYVL